MKKLYAQQSININQSKKNSIELSRKTASVVMLRKRDIIIQPCRRGWVGERWPKQTHEEREKKHNKKQISLVHNCAWLRRQTAIPHDNYRQFPSRDIYVTIIKYLIKQRSNRCVWLCGRVDGIRSSDEPCSRADWNSEKLHWWYSNKGAKTKPRNPKPNSEQNEITDGPDTLKLALKVIDQPCTPERKASSIPRIKHP